MSVVVVQYGKNKVRGIESHNIPQVFHKCLTFIPLVILELLLHFLPLTPLLIFILQANSTCVLGVPVDQRSHKMYEYGKERREKKRARAERKKKERCEKKEKKRKEEKDGKDKRKRIGRRIRMKSYNGYSTYKRVYR